MAWPLLIALALSAPPPPEAPDAPLPALDEADDEAVGSPSGLLPEGSPSGLLPEARTRIHGGRYDPQPTSVLGRERLAETAGGDLSAALDSEPGLTVTRLGGLGMFSTLSVRGSTPEQVLVALDGIPLNPADGAPVDLSTLPVGPLDALAIHRGRIPWSLGVTGLGGALILHARTPDVLAADAELALGAFETAALRTFVGAPIALGRDRTLTLSLALDSLHSASDYRFDNDNGTAWTTSDDHTDNRRNAAADQLTLLGRAGLDLGDLRLTLIDLHSEVRRGLPSLGVTPTSASRFALTRHLVALRLDATPGPLVLAATTWLALSTSDVWDPLGEIGLDRGHAGIDSTVPGAVVTLRLPLAPSRGLRLVPSLHLAWRLESTSGTHLATSERQVASLAAELTLRHRLGLELATGVRGELTWAPPAANSDAPDRDANALAAFLEAAISLDHLRLSLAARLAPRLPSLFELHGDTGLSLGNPDLRPESATTLEAGARWEPPGHDLPLAIALFAYATWAADLIQFIQNAQGVTRPDNLASARILGLELQLEATFFDRLHLRSSLAVMDAIDTSDIAARAGKRLPLRPTLATSHRLELRLPDATLGATRGATGIYLELDHVAGNHLDYANLVALPARTLIGAGAFVRSDHAEVLLSLSNLLSDRIQDLAGYPLPGLTTMLSLRLTTGPE